MNAPPLRLLLARHGEVLANRELRYVGSRDEPLADSGIAQAESLAAAVAPLPVRAVYSSPLSRARETGGRIAAARATSPSAWSRACASSRSEIGKGSPAPRC